MDAEDEAWAGIAAFYSIIHIPRDEVVSALVEFKRVLQPAGLLLLAFHIGEEIVHLEEWWERPVSVDFVFFQPDEMAGYLKTSGFEVEEVIERAPYENIEHPSRRAYIFRQEACLETPHKMLILPARFFAPSITVPICRYSI